MSASACAGPRPPRSPSISQPRGALLVLDRGYLAIQKRWYGEIAAAVKTRIVQVEGDVVVPVEIVSDKHEFAARTLRPKLHKHLEDYVAPLTARRVKHRAGDDLPASELDIADPDAMLAGMTLDRVVGPVRASPAARPRRAGA